MKPIFYPFIFAFVVLSGCENNPPMQEPQPEKPSVARAMQPQAPVPPPLPRVILIVDNSVEMTKMDSHHGDSQMNNTNEVVADMLEKLPENTHKVSLFTYNGCEPKLLLKEHEQNFAVLRTQITDIKADSNRPLAKTLQYSSEQLQTDNTIIIISSGQDDCSGDPCAVAQSLKQNEQYQATVHAIGYNVDDSSKAQLQCMTNVSGGQYVDATDAYELDMKLNELVREHISKEVDHDGDGVANAVDECADTPKGFSVDKVGCETYYTLKINFPSGSAEIQPQFEYTIKRLVDYLKTNQRKVQLQGHTDSQASAAYNRFLSERRAQAVRDKLLEYGITAERLTAVGFGESRPISLNQSNAGRYRNRRVEAHILK